MLIHIPIHRADGSHQSRFFQHFSPKFIQGIVKSFCPGLQFHPAGGKKGKHTVGPFEINAENPAGKRETFDLRKVFAAI